MKPIETNTVVTFSEFNTLMKLIRCIVLYL